MGPLRPSKLDEAMALVCLNCPVCHHARKHQAGAAFWFVNKVEEKACIFCRAYERVHGRKAHQRIDGIPEAPPT